MSEQNSTQTNCPYCNEDINESAIESMTVNSDGSVCVVYTCPQCAAALVFTIPAEDEIAAELSPILAALGDIAYSDYQMADSISFADFDEEEVDDEPEPEIEPEVESVPVPESEPEAESVADESIKAVESEAKVEEDSEPKRQVNLPGVDAVSNPDSVSSSRHAVDTSGRQVNINYSTVPNPGTVTFNFMLMTPEKKIATCTPTDYEKAQLEYFHRQIEQLGSVDEAIDEIDAGYKPEENI